jgi:ABC-type sulfate transport system permease component
MSNWIAVRTKTGVSKTVTVVEYPASVRNLVLAFEALFKENARNAGVLGYMSRLSIREIVIADEDSDAQSFTASPASILAAPEAFELEFHD